MLDECRRTISPDYRYRSISLVVEGWRHSGYVATQRSGMTVARCVLVAPTASELDPVCSVCVCVCVCVLQLMAESAQPEAACHSAVYSLVAKHIAVLDRSDPTNVTVRLNMVA